MIKAVTRVHEAVFRASRGKLLNRGSGMPVLMLTSDGQPALIERGQGHPVACHFAGLQDGLEARVRG